MNWEEDMVGMLRELVPFRWKVFQVLVVVGQNESDVRKRDARKFIISDEQFNAFIERHKDLKCMVPEPNQVMKSSYLVSRLLHERAC
jgi:radical S-adenosyl methionine domain-containing protein 2